MINKMRKKLKTFFYTFKNSLLKPDYYREVLKAPFSFSLKYFLFLFSFLNFLTALTISLLLFQRVSPAIKTLQTKTVEIYPQELKITIKKGQVSANVNQPYFIPLKADLFSGRIKQGLENHPIQNILVIDTQSSASEIDKYQTFALLTKDSIALRAENNEIRIHSLREIEDLTINREKIAQLWEKIAPFLSLIVPLISLLLLIFLPLFRTAFKFAYLLVFSLLALAVAKIFKLKINYRKALQLNLQAITVPTVIIALFEILGTRPNIPFFQTIILLFFNLIIFTSLKEEKKKIGWFFKRKD